MLASERRNALLQERDPGAACSLSLLQTAILLSIQSTASTLAVHCSSPRSQAASLGEDGAATVAAASPPPGRVAPAASSARSHSRLRPRASSRGVWPSLSRASKSRATLGASRRAWRAPACPRAATCRGVEPARHRASAGAPSAPAEGAHGALSTLGVLEQTAFYTTMR